VDDVIKEKWSMVRKDDFRKTTRDLMEVLFTTEEMMTSSLTGSKGHTGSLKQPLNQQKVSAIIC
jgi:BEN domain